jgi:hypothetical protein
LVYRPGNSPGEQRKGIPLAGSAGGTLILYNTLYAAKRLWLASAIRFLGVWSLNQQICTVSVRDLCLYTRHRAMESELNNLGLHNKPKAAVYAGAFTQTGPREEEL